MPTLEPDYPKAMFKPNEGPIYARDAKHEKQLCEQGWSPNYIRREFPKMIYRPGVKQSRIVETPQELAEALDEGWSKDPEPCHYGEIEVAKPQGIAPMVGAPPAAAAPQNDAQAELV